LLLLAESDGINARRALLNTLANSGVPTHRIMTHLGDLRWYVVRNMVYLLGTLRDDTALPALERTLGHPDERVRREVVRTLGNLSAPRAAQLVELALSDPASSVRVLAAPAVARQRGPRAAAVLLEHVTAKDFAARPESEAQAFLEALGNVADDSAVSSLDVLWHSRLFLRSRPLHVRLGALGALSRIATPRARHSLERASRSSDRHVRGQAKKCLAEADRRVGTP
jgi:HEAT repeat protein